MDQNQPSEMPKQLRELAEKNVEQARATLHSIHGRLDASDECVVDGPSNVMTSGFKELQELAIRFAKENAEAGFTLASELANAKDIQAS